MASKTPEESAAQIKEVIAEIRFYLKHAMNDQADAALDRLRQLKPDAAALSLIEREYNAAVEDASANQSHPAEDISFVDADEAAPQIVSALDSVSRISLPTPTPAPAVPAWPEPQVASAKTVAPAVASGPLGDFVADL